MPTMSGRLREVVVYKNRESWFKYNFPLVQTPYFQLQTIPKDKE